MDQPEAFSINDLKGSPCPPLKLDINPTCDVLNLSYYLDVVTEKIPVEVGLHYRVKRCSLEYMLGDLLYSTTLLPQERVWLSFRNRHSVSRLTDDRSFSAHSHSYSNEYIWMDTFRTMSTDIDQTYGEVSTGYSHSTSSSKSGGGFSFFGLFGSGNAKSSGSHDSHSVATYANELHRHLESTYHQTNTVSRMAESVSITEVSSHREVETEVNDEVKVGVRVFKNPNYCHALTFLFYQIARKQEVSIELTGTSYRAITPDADTSVRMKDYVLSVAENPEILKLSDRVNLAEKGYKFATLNNPSTSMVAAYALMPEAKKLLEAKARPVWVKDSDAYKSLKDAVISVKEPTKEDAEEKVKEKIEAKKIKFKYVNEFLLPTNAVYVDSAMGSCNSCEPFVLEKQRLEIERLKLQNALLEKQTELLDKHKDYTCCPEENDEDD